MRGRRPYTGDRGLSTAVHYLYGGYPGANLGDEMIHSTVEGLLSPAHCAFTARFVPPLEWLSFWVGKRKLVSIVLGGGTISPRVVLQDPRLGASTLPLFAFGLGYNTPSEFATRSAAETHYNLWRRFVERCDVQLFGTRGPRSLQKFSEFVPHAKMTGDTALAAFDVLGAREKEFIALNFGQHRPNVTPQKAKAYARLIVELSRHGLPLVFIPLHSADVECLQTVLKVPGFQRPKYFTWLENIPSEIQLRSLLSRIAFGVGERLHFSIPLIASGIPSIMLAYADKHYDFAESVNAQDYIIPSSSDFCADVLAKANAMLTEGANISARVIEAVTSRRRVLFECFDDLRRRLTKA